MASYRTDRAVLAAAAIDDLVQARVKDGRTPASSWALLAPEGVVATGGAGDPAPAPDTAFRVASCTKSFTAAALLQVVEAGRLTLDTPLSDVLDVRVLGSSRAPTLGELASMAGGIPIDDPWADRQESMTADAFDAMLADCLRLVREPGTRYEYSSLAYSILGRVLEVVTGTPYPRLVHERLIEPLGLTVAYDRTGGAPIAPGHAKVRGEWVEQPWTEPGSFSALGGIVASPSALAAWDRWLAAAWRDDADDAVLSAASRRLMQQPRTPVPDTVGTHYGLGLVIDEDPRHGRVVSHSGGYPGYGANMRWHPASGLGAVVLENARYSGATLPATKALQLVLDAALVPDAEPDLWPETAAARDVVEGLLRGWDDAVLEPIASDNLAMDESFALRREAVERLVARAEVAGPVLPLADAAPWSDSPAHLTWSVPGAAGSLRCEIRMTPVARPLLQTLVVRLA